MGTHRKHPWVVCDPLVGLELVEESESCARSPSHGHCDRMIQRYNRLVSKADESFIQLSDLGPIGGIGAGRFIMKGGDHRLQLIWPDVTLIYCLADQGVLSRIAQHGKGAGT